MGYLILIVGALAVLAAWDIGRRFVATKRGELLSAEIESMRTEIGELREQVANVGVKAQQALERTAKVGAFLEAAKQPNARPPSLFAR